jgi:argininosuccinate lyase
VTEQAWGGVFREATDRRVEEFTESVSFDKRSEGRVSVIATPIASLRACHPF